MINEKRNKSADRDDKPPTGERLLAERNPCQRGGDNENQQAQISRPDMQTLLFFCPGAASGQALGILLFGVHYRSAYQLGLFELPIFDVERLLLRKRDVSVESLSSAHYLNRATPKISVVSSLERLEAAIAITELGWAWSTCFAGTKECSGVSIDGGRELPLNAHWA